MVRLMKNRKSRRITLVDLVTFIAQSHFDDALLWYVLSVTFQGSHSLEKSLNLKGKSLKSPFTFP